MAHERRELRGINNCSSLLLLPLLMPPPPAATAPAATAHQPLLLPPPPAATAPAATAHQPLLMPLHTPLTHKWPHPCTDLRCHAAALLAHSPRPRTHLAAHALAAPPMHLHSSQHHLCLGIHKLSKLTAAGEKVYRGECSPCVTRTLAGCPWLPTRAGYPPR